MGQARHGVAKGSMNTNKGVETIVTAIYMIAAIRDGTKSRHCVGIIAGHLRK